jgi:hypothetical protein
MATIQREGEAGADFDPVLRHLRVGFSLIVMSQKHM